MIYLEVFENKLIVVYVSEDLFILTKTYLMTKKMNIQELKTNLVKDKLFDEYKFGQE